MDMRVLLFANNWVGWQVARCLRNQGDQIVGLVIHPEVRRKYGTQIVKTSQVAPENLFTGTELSEPSVLRRIAALKPELGVSAFFGYILKQHLLDFLPRGCVNIHSSLLPYNRGGSPHVWGIVEGTPAGVTLHHIDPGIDTGDIIAQRPVPVEQADTGRPSTAVWKTPASISSMRTGRWSGMGPPGGFPSPKRPAAPTARGTRKPSKKSTWTGPIPAGS